jgi:hypothetical protein
MTKKNLDKLDDAALDAEHQARMDAVTKAKDAYAKHGDAKHGQALYDARLAAGETQAEQNDRHGAPPPQHIGS